jgi:hypothetical protein
MKRTAICEINIPKGVTLRAFSQLYPHLYHMAQEDAWASIQCHGLLSTTSILNLWQVNGSKRYLIEREVRRSAVELDHPRYGKVIIRDQKPMCEQKLRKGAYRLYS